jgi:hypothetical protein
MLHFLVVRSQDRQALINAIPRAWRGGQAACANVAFPTKPGYPPQMIHFAWAEAARAQRAAVWPDVLGEWIEIYEEKFFPDDTIPVLAEECSALGAEPLAVFGDNGLGRVTMAWYRKGALVEIEHVGSAAVAWLPDSGLGRPFDGSMAQMASHAGLVGKLAGRMQGVSMAAGETILHHAFFRMLEQDPPEISSIAGMVAAAQAARVAC